MAAGPGRARSGSISPASASRPAWVWVGSTRSIPTLRRSGSLGEFEREFAHRLAALSRVQGLITGVDYRNVDLRDLLTAELQAHDRKHLDTSRIRLDGPALPLSAAAAQALGLAL